MLRIGFIAGLTLIALVSAGAAVLWNSPQSIALLPDAADAGPQAKTETAAGDDPVAVIASAIRNHDAAAIERGLAGVDPDSVDADGETLLNKAVLFGTPEIVEILLKAGADPNAPGKNGLGPLAVAALAGHHDMLQRLMAARSERAAISTSSAPEAPQFDPPQAAAIAAAAVRAQPPAGSNAATPAASSGANHRGGLAAPARPGDAVVASPARSSPAKASQGMADVPTDNHAGPPPVFRLPPSRAALTRPPMSADTGPAPAESAGPFPVNGSPTVGPLPANAAAASTAPPTPWVVAVQKRLNQLGYYKGAVDGVAGPQTANAITSYQAVAGLPQDGLVSEALLSRIGARVEAPQEAVAAAQMPTQTPTQPPEPRDGPSAEAAGAPRSGE